MSIKIGWASRDVSTDKPIKIPGQAHQRISQGILDPVTTTALVLDDGSDCVVFMSLDMVDVRMGLLDEVRQKTAALRPDIPVKKIILSATHAHTGPCHYEETYGTAANNRGDDPMPIRVEVASSTEYRHWLSDTMADMIAEAWDKRAEGGIAYGYGYAVVAHSRRVCYFDDVSERPENKNSGNTYAINGHTVMYGNTNDPNFSHYEAGADHFINILYTFDGDGKLTGAILNIPCPSQNSEGIWKLSASYWNEVRVAIRKKYGNIFLLSQCAAAGDLSPRILHYKQAEQRRFRLKYGIENNNDGTEMGARLDIGERVAAAFDEVYSWAKKDIRTDVTIDHRVSEVEMERRLITDEELAYAKANLAKMYEQDFAETDDPMADFVKNSTLCANRRRFNDAIERYERQKTQPMFPMEMHVLRVGDIAFASNCHELFMDFQHRIQARSPFAQTFIIQLAAQPGIRFDCNFYLCTERAAWGKGYSTSMFCTQASPKGGQQLVEETLSELNALHENMK